MSTKPGVSKAERSSTILSKHLRHNPGKDESGQPNPIDKAGYMSLALVLKIGTQEGWLEDDYDLINMISNNFRFELSPGSWDEEDVLDWANASVRACSGHSIDVDLGYTEFVPQNSLWLGTSTRASQRILSEGLHCKERKHVRLFDNIQAAESLAQQRERTGAGEILEINAVALHVAGHRFLLASNGEVLTDEISPDFIQTAAIAGFKI